MRRACPPPHQPFTQECVIGDVQLAYSGLNTLGHVDGLSPYTNYAFQVTSFNDYGKNESEWETALTSKLSKSFIVSSIW